MSDYFTYTNLAPNTVARAAEVNSRFAGVAAGFDLLPPPAYLRDDRLTYSVDTGSVNALVATPAIPITSYTSGLHIVLKAANANTGAVTVNVSGLGVKSVKRADGSALQTGDIVVGQILDLTYDGTDFRLSMAFADLSPAGVVAKLQAAGSFSLGTNASLTISGSGQLIAPSATINSQALTPTALGASLVNAANQASARSALGLGTMAVETATNYVTNASLTSTLASYALLASPPLTGTPTAPTAAPGTNTTQLATTAFVTAAVAAGAGSIPNGDKGDITTSAGGTVWTIDDNAVTLAKMADMATGSLIYRRTGGTGDPEVNTLAQLKSDLGLVGNNTGDQTITLTGDVTGSGQASFAATIANNTVTYAKMQDASAGNVVLTRASATSGDYGETALAASRLLGRGSSGDIAAISLDSTLTMGASSFGVASSVALAGNPTTTTQSVGNNTTRLATTAFVQAEFNASMKRTLPVMAGAITPRTTNGSAPLASLELVTNDIMIATLDFDQTTSEAAQFMVPMPKSWDEGTVTYDVLWTAGSGSGTVTWAVSALAIGNDDAMDSALGAEISVTDTLISTNDMHVSPVSSALTIAGSPAAEDIVVWQIRRDIADTLTADAKLIGIRIYYNTTARDDT